MHILIDESGLFVPPTGKPHSHSLVLALLVPSSRHDQLCYEFIRLRDTWPDNAIEVKGSRLTEKQTAQVADLLVIHDALIVFQAIDMALHGDDRITEFKQQQAAAVTANLTPLHQPTMVRELEELAATFNAMSNQLFVQAFLTIRLVINSLQVGTLYYVQRTPDELGRFCWIIDRKDRDLTSMERAWSTLILPAGEALSVTEPFRRLPGADYSHFAKYEASEATADPGSAQHHSWMRETYKLDKPPGSLRFLDWRRLINEERSFRDSKDDLGLQLADISATTLRRAFMNHLGPEGWEPFGRLMVHQSATPFVLLGNPDIPKHFLDDYATTVWKKLQRHMKSMIIDE